MREQVRFMRGNEVVSLDGVAARATLLEWLRTVARAVGTKEGCAEGDCGACTVVLERVRDGRVTPEAVNACVLLAGQADGARVLTIEDLARGNDLHPVQDAMIRHHGAQCGFCTPGIVMSLYALHASGSRPVSRDMVCDQLAGNLCRCTGYRPIIDAALEACAGETTATAPSSDLLALDDDQDIFIGDETDFFAAPRTETVLADLYIRHPDARLIAGATDFGLNLTKQLEQPRKLIWLGRVKGLDAIASDARTLHLGATVSHAAAMPHLAAINPDLGEIMRRFGSVQVRNSGTVGGNIANASPIGDLAPCLIALGSQVELQRGSERRTIALEDFFVAYKRQDRRPDEFVRGVRVTKPLPGQHFRAVKITKRMDEDISSVLGAFLVAVEGRRIASARIAFGGMAAIPARAKQTEIALTGAGLDDPASWNGAIENLARDFQPIDDHRASAAYRALVARNLLRKALIEIAGTSTGQTRLVAHREVRDAAE